MQRFSVAIPIALSLSVGSALAADLPSIKGPPRAPLLSLPTWTGFYAGLNAGYGFGGSDHASSTAVPFNDNIANFFNAGPPVLPGITQTSFSPLTWGVTSLANTGSANLNQNGFIGGGQIGYNYQLGSNLVIGVEADIQGSDIRGKGRHGGISGDAGNAGFNINGVPSTLTVTRQAAGTGETTAGVHWLGTVRGRAGWLPTPTLLVFGTGGLAYGGVQASAHHTLTLQQTAVATGNIFVLGPASNITQSFGAGHYSDTRVGWTAGGGLEWMFISNWSLKAEGLYYDLGSVSFASSPVGVYSPVNGSVLLANSPMTRVKYDGAIARAGVNYHFNWGVAPVAARY
jgi:outer membrane immunogenic protein